MLPTSLSPTWRRCLRANIRFEVADSDIRAIAHAEVAVIDHDRLRNLGLQHPRLADSMWRATLVDAAISREWVVNVGQREAINRMAHIFCEMMTRMQVAGLADGKVCRLPLTQIDLSETTGMSVVHVNRVLQQLRHTKLITLAKGRLEILNWVALVELADFRSDYLHIVRH